jgi:hypothetical protein
MSTLLALAVSTFSLGVADCDDLAISGNGDAYLACHTPTENGMAAHVIRVNLQTRRVIFRTRVSDTSTAGLLRIAIDRRGHVWAAGFEKANSMRALVVRVNPNGAISDVRSPGDGIGNGIAVARDGTVCAGGTTSNADVFVSCFHPDRDNSTVTRTFGGSAEEKLTGIAFDGRGGLLVAGYTRSADFPTIHALQQSLGGVSDAFLLRLPCRNWNRCSPHSSGALEMIRGGASQPIVRGMQCSPASLAPTTYPGRATGGTARLMLLLPCSMVAALRLRFSAAARTTSRVTTEATYKLIGAATCGLPGSRRHLICL